MRRFTAVISRDVEDERHGYNVEVPALPGCLAWGLTLEEAVESAQDAIETYLKGEDQVAFPGEAEPPALVAFGADADGAVRLIDESAGRAGRPAAAQPATR